MGTLGDWILLLPIVPALLVLGYTAWQAFKEIKPTVRQIKGLQLQITKTRELVTTFMTDVESTRANVTEQVEAVKGLVTDSRNTYDNMKGVAYTVITMDTLPVRRGINYLKQRREDRRLPKRVSYIRREAARLNTKLDQSEFSHLPSLLGLILGATALIFAFRRS